MPKGHRHSHSREQLHINQEHKRNGYAPAPRERTLGDLKKLQQAVIATTEETLELIERGQLQDSGCGAVDMSLLASVLLTPDTLLWTVDKNLDALSTRLGVAFRGAFG